MSAFLKCSSNSPYDSPRSERKAERIRVGADAVFLVAESIVVIRFDAYSAGIGEIYYVAVGVEGVIFSCRGRAGDQIRSPEIGGGMILGEDPIVFRITDAGQLQKTVACQKYKRVFVLDNKFIDPA